MKRPFRRKSAPEQTRRQRAQIDDSLKKSTSFSYHARRSDQELNVGRNEQREAPARLNSNRFGNFWLNRFGAIILLITLVVSAVNILSLSDSVKVVPLASEAKTPMLHSQATYEAAAQKIMSGSILNRNKLTVDSAKLSRDMRKQFPELATASVTVPLLAHRPIVYVQTERPVLILAASNGSYILSNSGRALVASTKLQALDSLNLPQVGDQSGLSVTIGQQVLSSQNTRFIEFVSKELDAKNITISAMTLPAATSQLDVQLIGKPYSVKFNLQSNTARQQVGTFLATVSQLEKQNITPSKYIDVRVDGRAYYQ